MKLANQCSPGLLPDGLEQALAVRVLDAVRADGRTVDARTYGSSSMSAAA
jgi:hypothetical protein